MESAVLLGGLCLAGGRTIVVGRPPPLNNSLSWVSPFKEPGELGSPEKRTNGQTGREVMANLPSQKADVQEGNQHPKKSRAKDDDRDGGTSTTPGTVIPD